MWQSLWIKMSGKHYIYLQNLLDTQTFFIQCQKLKEMYYNKEISPTRQSWLPDTAQFSPSMFDKSQQPSKLHKIIINGRHLFSDLKWWEAVVSISCVAFYVCKVPYCHILWLVLHNSCVWDGWNSLCLRVSREQSSPNISMSSLNAICLGPWKRSSYVLISWVCIPHV